MTGKVITVSFLVLIVATLATALKRSQPEGSLRLSYNPTYEFWFFLPTGRPSYVSDKVSDAYWERRPGGVCYMPDDNWFYCATGEKI